MGGSSPERGSTPTGAVFLSYASQDAEAAQKICDALRAAGIEVWFDKSELRGGDVWDRQIREQIHDCRLFIPVISANTEARDEGYFRREWGLATDRTRDMAEKRAFLIPVVIDDTPERGSSVPDKFHQIHWTRLPGGKTSPAFVARVAALLGAPAPVATAAGPSPAPVSLRPAGTRNRRAVWIPLGLAALASIVVGAWFALQHSGLRRHAQAATAGQSQPAITEKSIAVLPFVDLSEKHDQEYFADGMAEEIINLLVKIPELKVIGRTSSFQFKGKAGDLRKIGATLGTAYVVEGSVRRAGDHVRVAAQLIDTRDGTHRWSETYDREANDTLKVQDEIAASLVRALQLEVTSVSHLQGRVLPKNSEVYDGYLRGLHALSRYDQRGFDEAAAHFRHALEVDPSFVPAAAQLARALFDQASFGFVPPQRGFEQARVAANQALRLDSGSALAHAYLGGVHFLYDWDWPAAEQELRTAVTLAPDDPTVLLLAAEERMVVGQLLEAVNFADAAVAADPLHAAVYEVRAWVCLRLGRPADAERANRRLLEISPTYVFGHYDLGIVLVMRGRAEAALTEMQQEASLGAQTGGLAVTYYALHRTKDADTALTRLEVENAGDMAMYIAETYAFRGRKDEAFKWLDRAYAQKDIWLWTIKGDPLLKNLQAEPRYKAFLRKMNLPE
jgi:TolB-like protein/Flp pilus assembly protein TadD